MNSSEIIKQAIRKKMPDADEVQKQCIGELHREKERQDVDKGKPDHKVRKAVAAGMGLCAAVSGKGGYSFSAKHGILNTIQEYGMQCGTQNAIQMITM